MSCYRRALWAHQTPITWVVVGVLRPRPVITATLHAVLSAVLSEVLLLFLCSSLINSLQFSENLGASGHI